jgi:hypothetical protein
VVQLSFGFFPLVSPSMKVCGAADFSGVVATQFSEGGQVLFGRQQAGCLSEAQSDRNGDASVSGRRSITNTYHNHLSLLSDHCCLLPDACCRL